MTSAYKTSSTHALQVIAGVLPLDLELKLQAYKQKHKMELIDNNDLERAQNDIIDTWQNRWNLNNKGRWTWKLIPSIRQRLNVPLPLDHYTTQMLSGHGDFMGKLREFKLVASGRCHCNVGSETVEHVLLRCKRIENLRTDLKSKLMSEGVNWPPYDGELLRNRTVYEAFSTFARKALTRRTDR